MSHVYGVENKVNNGLYNIIFGEFEHADKLLDILDLDKAMFGRYRDCFPNNDGTRIIVLTRCGGGNRKDFEIVFTEMRKHPQYLGDYDDPTDETYCYFEFEVPVLYLPQTKPLADGEPVLTIGAKFEIEKNLLDKNDPGAMKRADKIAKSMQSQIDANPDGGIIFMGDSDWKYTKEGKNGK